VTPPFVSAHARTAPLDALVAGACGTRYSAAVVRVEHGGRAVYERAVGTMRSDGGAAVYGDTLDEPLLAFVPEWRGTAHASITLRMLLAHTAGFRSGADYRTLFDAHIETFALGETLVAAPGDRVVYSDLGFLALGAILARCTGCALEPLVERELRALGAANVTYARHVVPAATPATERDTWRGLVQGRVHDEKAALAGGVAGHAGLFGDAADVARLAEWYLGPLHGRPSPLPDVLRRAAIAEQAPDAVLRRGLGWALKTRAENSCGERMTAQTFGHTGFTGTCVWADPDRDLTIVILTNAVHFGRHDLRAVRAAICDAAVMAFAA
jgi:CubicO group peptidase (beta-lactamase class C family)